MFETDLFLIGPGIQVPTDLSRKERKRARKASRARRFSANLVVDIGNTCIVSQSYPGVLSATANASGLSCGLSGTSIGQSIDLINANTWCNLWVAGTELLASGNLIMQVQTSDTDVSGNYTDPTSGFASLPPGGLLSGGLLTLGSGTLAAPNNGTFGPFQSGQSLLSGFAVAAGFTRPQRYVRLNMLQSGNGIGNAYCGLLQGGFISNLKITGSGGGFSYSPSSGVPSV